MLRQRSAQLLMNSMSMPLQQVDDWTDEAISMKKKQVDVLNNNNNKKKTKKSE